ncbi:hypothetical protein HAX54_026746 [Datura stramonium]|uniref:Uncharacterized protein n=1 Tax=Datura stramonium TaxID=4076 RepID=A0ABS8S853_DATST|nr:hypothetical protein [Datura stramonium]
MLLIGLCSLLNRSQKDNNSLPKNAIVLALSSYMSRVSDLSLFHHKTNPFRTHLKSACQADVHKFSVDSARLLNCALR